jgi:hypothetical protein
VWWDTCTVILSFVCGGTSVPITSNCQVSPRTSTSTRPYGQTTRFITLIYILRNKCRFLYIYTCVLELNRRKYFSFSFSIFYFIPSTFTYNPQCEDTCLPSIPLRLSFVAHSKQRPTHILTTPNYIDLRQLTWQACNGSDSMLTLYNEAWMS